MKSITITIINYNRLLYVKENYRFLGFWAFPSFHIPTPKTQLDYTLRNIRGGMRMCDFKITD
jgi:hypothetical protein